MARVCWVPLGLAEEAVGVMSEECQDKLRQKRLFLNVGNILKLEVCDAGKRQP